MWPLYFLLEYSYHLQGAVPEILEQSMKKFFSKTNGTLGKAADACYATISEIPSLTCPHKPEGAMSTMVMLDKKIESIFS